MRKKEISPTELFDKVESDRDKKRRAILEKRAADGKRIRREYAETMSKPYIGDDINIELRKKCELWTLNGRRTCRARGSE